MNFWISIFKATEVMASSLAVVLTAGAAHAAQNEAPPGPDVQSAVMEAAKTRLEQSGSLAEQVARAKGKSEEVQAMMRDRAAGLASSLANRSAEQLRARLPGNAQISQPEATKPCDNPAHLTRDDPALCKPGSND